MRQLGRRWRRRSPRFGEATKRTAIGLSGGRACDMGRPWSTSSGRGRTEWTNAGRVGRLGQGRLTLLATGRPQKPCRSIECGADLVAVVIVGPLRATAGAAVIRPGRRRRRAERAARERADRAARDRATWAAVGERRADQCAAGPADDPPAQGVRLLRSLAARD